MDLPNFAKESLLGPLYIENGCILLTCCPIGNGVELHVSLVLQSKQLNSVSELHTVIFPPSYGKSFIAWVHAI